MTIASLPLTHNMQPVWAALCAGLPFRASAKLLFWYCARARVCENESLIP